jgi:hypothetical protein
MPAGRGETPPEETATGDAATRSVARQWLLLTHQIPPTPAYLRVKVRRQLERFGAVAVKNSVYLLPPGDDTREDFEWLCREIERCGGETTLCLATFLDQATDERLRAAFDEARAADYREIARAAGDLRAEHEERLMRDETPIGRSRAGALRRKLEAVQAIDFFTAPEHDDAERALSELERRLGDRPAAGREPGDPALHRPRGRTWVTREGIKVDRMASAWLIRRFIDPEASFKFVPANGYRPLEGELRFDMFDGEYTHEGDRCTFETLLARFALEDPALTAVAEIVHDIDCKEDRFGRGEVGGISSLIDGIVRSVPLDEERLERGATLFDGLWEHFRAQPGAR